jgi:hypothetical protein
VQVEKTRKKVVTRCSVKKRFLFGFVIEIDFFACLGNVGIVGVVQPFTSNGAGIALSWGFS